MADSEMLEPPPEGCHKWVLPEFLSALGKQDLRPAGSYGTRRLLAKMNLPAESLVIASSLKAPEHTLQCLRAAGHIAHAYHPRHVGGGLDFDGALVDGLPLDSGLNPAEFLHGIGECTRSGAPLGLAGLCWRQLPPAELIDAVNEAWGGRVYMLTPRRWWDIAEEAGFAVRENEMSVLQWLTPRNVAEEPGAATMLARLARSGAAARRFAEWTSLLHTQGRYLGVILLWATRR